MSFSRRLVLRLQRRYFSVSTHAKASTKTSGERDAAILLLPGCAARPCLTPTTVSFSPAPGNRDLVGVSGIMASNGDGGSALQNEERQDGARQGGQQGHKRHGSIERYRPGAFNRDHHREEGRAEAEGNGDPRPLPVENHGRDRHSDRRGGRRGGGGWGRGRGRGRGGGGGGWGPRRDHDEDQLAGHMESMSLGGGGDLRQRLNQRSSQPMMPNVKYANGEEGARSSDHGDGGRGGRRNHSRLQGRGGVGGSVAGKLPLPKRNTENFNPSHEPTDMRLVVAHPGRDKYDRECTSRDVIMVLDLFCEPDDMGIYDKLLAEIKNCGVDQDILWQSWHGDSHVIADDKKRWKDACPTFHWVVDRLAHYFDMDVKATRLNWYRDSREWKPFHHDAAAVKPDKARTQNFTVAVSFGLERDAAFEHARTKTTLSLPQPNGCVYTFGRDVNILWRHGILQMPDDQYSDQGRISIIAWGWNKQRDV